jgi:hypothetical protein
VPRRAEPAGARRRWFLLPFALLACGIGVAFAAGGRDEQPASVEHLRDFDEFMLVYPGDSVGGHRLEAALSSQFVGFSYGTCEPQGEERWCSSPLDVQVWSACTRNLSMYGADVAPQLLGTRRGVRLYRAGADLEFQTGDATVAIFGPPELALDAFDALRGLNRPIDATDSLPKPVPGALDGTLACRS